MKIIVTGSLGNISKPLTEELVQKGHQVIVISSNIEKLQAIENLGAIAAIGSVDDGDFLAKTFYDADVVYTMVPPNYFADEDIREYYRKIGIIYKKAIKESGVKRVVNLSSYGAHLDKGTGIILGSHFVEQTLNELSDVKITHIRPTYFYYNLMNLIPMIKSSGIIFANYGGEKSFEMVSPIDIASAILEEIEMPSTHRKIRYVSSDTLSGVEIANILGAKVGKPDLKWIVVSDDETRKGFLDSGFPELLSNNYVEMFSSLNSGKLAEDYKLNKPAVLGKVKFSDFVNDFVTTYNS
ncbi:NmrA family NAD(P)-binding protein [Flavobacterium turcicum]|uniref:NmrA family NAD(P)-binding protein n=1 Tax=Flavobacterium turcicum TaxID=2764718 RepID=A0ABR7JE89_9FLAO|nr:NmrA family NAD(P)-binding protein [Flavobacterium turcicum]MBC5862821.1 NmrA family NAD(P)-binding protein [Flavobacterium turcicum]NHL01553.1 NmrA family NAD(P)-binding protein [Flavobacterium turcicum]